jgi:hypothetical protein
MRFLKTLSLVIAYWRNFMITAETLSSSQSLNGGQRYFRILFWHFLAMSILMMTAILYTARSWLIADSSPDRIQIIIFAIATKIGLLCIFRAICCALRAKAYRTKPDFPLLLPSKLGAGICWSLAAGYLASAWCYIVSTHIPGFWFSITIVLMALQAAFMCMVPLMPLLKHRRAASTVT